MKKNSSTNFSLTSTVVSILLVTAVLIQITMGGIFYFWQRSSQYKDLHIQLQQISDQAGFNLENPIWNFDNEQIMQIVHNFMLIPDVERITVKNSSGMLLFDQIREKSGNIGKSQIFSEKRKLFKKDTPLGSVEVTMSTDLTNQRLHNYLISIIFSILILALVQIITLYLLIRKTIISPLQAIENFAAHVSSQASGIPDPPKGFFTGEMRNLRNSITSMVVALHNSEKNYRSIFENSQEGIFQTTLDGRFIKTNSALADILGYSSPEELQTAVTDIGQQLHFDNNSRKKLIESDVVAGQELVLRQKDGHSIDCLISMHAIRNDRGEVDFFEGSLVDISKRKRAEEQLASMNQQLESLVEQRTSQLNRRNDELAASEERYRNLVETMQEGLLVIDYDGKVTYVNQQMGNMLGLTPDELIGRECISLIETKYQNDFEKKLKITDGQYASKFEINFIRADGHIVSTLVAPTVFIKENDQGRSTFAVVTDITNLKHLQAQLLNAQKLESIGQLAAGIAHEINTPIQYVQNNVRFLDDIFKEFIEVLAAYETLFKITKMGISTANALKEIEASREDHQLESLFTEIPEAFHDTFEGLERIANIVRSIKRFAHPGQDTTAIADINDAIQTTVTISTNEWKYVAVIETDLDPTLPQVPCDISAINQVILNLIVNAAHSIAEKKDRSVTGKGTITISTRNLLNFIEIRIRDTGLGIPENIRHRIFDPFFTTKSIGKGTGQGLAISRAIITETHNGTLDFETEIGRGTTFIIHLPLQVK